MIARKRVLGLIPARGGSKGLPGKNIHVIGGKPLIAWTIEAARKSAYLDRLVLSSDADEIMNCAREFGCDVPFRREPALATDTATSIDVVLDALVRCPGFDWVVLLQPTSPLRTAQDIDATLERCFALNAPAGVTVSLAQESPYWMYTLHADGQLSNIMGAASASRRQDLPPAYILNGAVYAADTKWIVQSGTFMSDRTVGHLMPNERSVDIDDLADVVVAEFALRNQKSQGV
jgi:CMP-N,N'-diacetyllegionaminic acid synthase